MTRTRGAALIAGSLLLGLGLAPLPASASTTDTVSCRATPVFPAVWNGGFDFQFVITNTGTVPINVWTVAWDMPSGDTLAAIWNGQATQVGQHVTVTNYPYGYSVSIPPGGSANSFAGLVQGNGGTNFTNITCAAGSAPAL